MFTLVARGPQGYKACEKVTSDLVVVMFDHHLIQTSHGLVFI